VEASEPIKGTGASFADVGAALDVFVCHDLGQCFTDVLPIKQKMPPG
jgi:hypothetical protein